MKNYIIKFCWATPLPIILQYNGKEKIAMDNKVIVKAKSEVDVIDKLKGTDYKIIANINNIVEC